MSKKERTPTMMGTFSRQLIVCGSTSTCADGWHWPLTLVLCSGYEPRNGPNHPRKGDFLTGKRQSVQF